MNRPASLPDYRWHISPLTPANICRDFSHIHPTLLQVLYNRGLATESQIQAFLEGHYLESRDPFLLPGMEKAVDRIGEAIDNEETIVVYGDFDADGVTSTVLLTQALRGLGMDRAKAQPYIPDRVDEGYGLNDDALTSLRQNTGADLVITVDCGIRAIAEVDHANAIGLDMIVTDHHSIGKRLPDALAVINPKLPDSTYPEDMLAGVGIAFKLAQALRMAYPERARYCDEDLLDLVAIGTVADLAPLLKENRLLVTEGLATLNDASRVRPGVAALLKVAGVRMGNVSAETIGFGLGPRINAAGRLAHAYSAARLLAVQNELQAGRYAAELNELNRRRQQVTRELGDYAEQLIDPNEPVLIAADSDFLPGVVGLVASRLAEKYYRPAIVAEYGEHYSHGSCRSISEVHITEALDSVSDLLERYGGHAQAAGFTIANERLPEFQERITDYIRRELAGKDLRPSVPVDAEIPLNEVDWALYEMLQQLEPTGYANATPIFVSRNLQPIGMRAVGTDGSHLQFTVTDGTFGRRCIAFRQGVWANAMPDRVDIAYTINLNEWRGQQNLQLMVRDVKETEEP